MSLSELIFNLLAWFVIHLSIGFGCSIIPNGWFSRPAPPYRTYRWEADGRLDERLFRVRSRRRLLPNGGALYPTSDDLRRLDSYKSASLEHWPRESSRTEFTNWLMIPPGFLFFIWWGLLFGLFMVAYAVLNILIPIVVQRDNRPRVEIRLSNRELKPSWERTYPDVALAGNG